MTTVLRYVIGGPAAREPELGDDPRRLFALALQQAIQADRSLTKPVKSHAAAIRDLFDPLHYLATYPAVAETGENPLLHYMRTGWREGFRPNPLFDVGYYREQMGRARGEPLLHYVTKGAEAGLNPHPLFDTRFYRENALAGEDAGLNPLAHYQARGGFERRAPSPWFDTARFLDALPFGADIACPLEAFVATRELHDRDVLAGFDAPLYRYQIEVERGLTLDEPPLVHYLREGYRDPTLLPNLLFDPQFYAERNALDLKKPALLHYLAEGDRLGLACHPLFSPAHYNKQRTDDPAAMTALEYFGRHPEAGFATDRRMSRPLDPAILAFLRRLIESGDAFDCQFYRAANADLAGLDDDYVVGHYLDHGQEEGRVGTPRDLMIKSGVKLRDFPLGFFADEYIYFHPDLKYLAGNPIGCLCHFLFHGRRENRMYGRWQFHYEDLVLDIPTDAAPLRVSPAPQRMDLCVLMHVYYADIWTELPAFVQNFRNRSYDVFINLVDLSWTPELHAEIRTLCPGAFLQLSNDLGRDVGGFMRLLDNVKLDRYDVVALMHTKKSPHIMPERGEHWRRTLLRAFAGSPEVADECVDAFLADPAVGMIGAKEWRS
ncbi:MAG TPA: rhamnan synthesis F family protein, partial [Stellaceae bacterium]|nr:rhamnan synthesis F family protein [Stellaceae bacterium]